jgi:hypothetical protein
MGAGRTCFCGQAFCWLLVTTHHEGVTPWKLRTRIRAVLIEVHLSGVDLSKVHTMGDLQGGLEEAERLLGCTVTRGVSATSS